MDTFFAITIEILRSIARAAFKIFRWENTNELIEYFIGIAMLVLLLGLTGWLIW